MKDNKENYFTLTDLPKISVDDTLDNPIIIIKQTTKKELRFYLSFHVNGHPYVYSGENDTTAKVWNTFESLFRDLENKFPDSISMKTLKCYIDHKNPVPNSKTYV